MAHLIACSECKKHLQVPDTLLGKKVQCPECKHTFIAALPEEEKTGTTAKPSSAPPRQPAFEEKSSGDDDEPIKKKKKKRYDDDDDDRDDDDDDDRPKRRRRSGRGAMAHRGGMILAFGIIGVVVMPIFGIIAWIMGNNDLREIRAGRMDPDGEGMTQAGRILGIIGTVLLCLYALGCVGYICVVGVFVAAIGANKGNMVPPQPVRKF